MTWSQKAQEVAAVLDVFSACSCTKNLRHSHSRAADSDFFAPDVASLAKMPALRSHSSASTEEGGSKSSVNSKGMGDGWDIGDGDNETIWLDTEEKAGPMQRPSGRSGKCLLDTALAILEQTDIVEKQSSRIGVQTVQVPSLAGQDDDDGLPVFGEFQAAFRVGDECRDKDNIASIAKQITEVLTGGLDAEFRRSISASSQRASAEASSMLASAEGAVILDTPDGAGGTDFAEIAEVARDAITAEVAVTETTSPDAAGMSPQAVLPDITSQRSSITRAADAEVASMEVVKVTSAGLATTTLQTERPGSWMHFLGCVGESICMSRRTQK